MYKQQKLFLVIFFLSFLFCGCATTIKVNVMRPSELDLGNVESIGVLSSVRKPTIFEYMFFNTDGYELSKDFAVALQSELIEENYFTVVDSNKISVALKNGEKIPCDIYISTEISDVSSKIKKIKVKTKDDTHIEYYRELNYSLNYLIVESQTGKILKEIETNFSNQSDSELFEEDVVSTRNLAYNDFYSVISKLKKQIMPYIENKRISLLKDKTKNPQMENADSLVKSGNLDLAFTEFIKIYNSTSLFEAGYNAACILEAQEKYEEALELMKEIYKKSGNKKAKNALDEIRFEITSRDKLQRQIEQRVN